MRFLLSHRWRAVLFGALLGMVICFPIFALAVQGSRTSENLRAACASANDSRAAERKLWGYILALPPQRPPTAQDLRVREQFKAFIAETFAPQDCGVK